MSATAGRSPIAAREADVLRAVLDYLAAKRIFHMRLNSGAFVFGEGKSRRFFRAARPGCADVLAIPHTWQPCATTGCCTDMLRPAVYWLECKTESGRQSEAQKQFQAEVEHQGHTYAIVRSIEDLKGLGL